MRGGTPLHGWDSWSAPAIIAGPVSTRCAQHLLPCLRPREPRQSGEISPAGDRRGGLPARLYSRGSDLTVTVSSAVFLALLVFRSSRQTSAVPAESHQLLSTYRGAPFQVIAILRTFNKEVRNCSYISTGHMFSSKLPSCLVFNS